MKMNYDNFILIISGPTASGKTYLSEEISEFFSSEVINADIGQFYKPFSIGTAKPNWESAPVKHHLFDIIDTPENLSVFQYRNLLKEKIQNIWKKNKLPVVVGGSLFYLKSLFFPPEKVSYSKPKINAGNYTWENLNAIDPTRAKNIHPNDQYRINRALSIWEKTGKKPSTLLPKYCPFFNSVFVFIDLDKEVLKKRIFERTRLMFKEGWVEEVNNYIDTPWEDFFSQKGLIGYKEIADWIKKGRIKQELEPLIVDIANKTIQYAKRQKTFWNSFEKKIKIASKKSDYFTKIIRLNSLDMDNLNFLKNYLLKEIKILVADN